jgi:hypothetical protein
MTIRAPPGAASPLEVMMAHSKTIAQLAGPSIVAVVASETVNFRIFASPDPHIVYLNGALLFLAGIAILRVHNVWVPRWPVLVTLTGWVISLLGLYRMFLPAAPQAEPNSITYAGLAILFAAGVVLTWKGYAADDTAV